MEKTSQIVVNWHVTEACNYHCKFCYSHWVRPQKSELWRDFDSSKTMILNLRRFLSPENDLWQGVFAAQPRLNFAGGEPTLWKGYLTRVVDFAYEAGFDVSLISNGSSPDTLCDLANKMTLVGLSGERERSDRACPEIAGHQSVMDGASSADGSTAG